MSCHDVAHRPQIRPHGQHLTPKTGPKFEVRFVFRKCCLSSSILSVKCGKRCCGGHSDGANRATLMTRQVHGLRGALPAHTTPAVQYVGQCRDAETCSGQRCTTTRLNPVGCGKRTTPDAAMPPNMFPISLPPRTAPMDNEVSNMSDRTPSPRQRGIGTTIPFRYIMSFH
jgi:hypothetical protein